MAKRYKVVDAPEASFGQYRPIDGQLTVVDNFIAPYKHEIGDAGYDMYCIEDTWIFPFRVTKVPVNIKCAIPEGYYGYMTSRSGETLKGNVVVPGIIDCTYRGVISALMTRIGILPKKLKKGTRIAQLIIHGYKEVNWTYTDDLSVTPRGDAGFGHTGLK